MPAYSERLLYRIDPAGLVYLRVLLCRPVLRLVLMLGLMLVLLLRESGPQWTTEWIMRHDS
jgi:hypothetical protein